MERITKKLEVLGRDAQLEKSVCMHFPVSAPPLKALPY